MPERHTRQISSCRSEPSSPRSRSGRHHVDLVAVEQMRDRTIAAVHLAVADHAKQGHQDLAEDRIVIDRQDEAEVAPGAQRVEGRAKAAF